MNILELFAGSRSFSNIAESLGHNTFTSDINAFDKIDYVTNIKILRIKVIYNI